MDLELTMDEDLKQEWLKALRSGEYQQTANRLFKHQDEDGGHCCLGVLLDISKKGHWVDHPYDTYNGVESYTTYEMDLGLDHHSMCETLHEAVLDEFGIPEYTAELLMSLNDGTVEYPQHSFDGIANIIEQGYYYKDDDDE